jgi:hypothetical protein
MMVRPAEPPCAGKFSVGGFEKPQLPGIVVVVDSTVDVVV